MDGGRRGCGRYNNYMKEEKTRQEVRVSKVYEIDFMVSMGSMRRGHGKEIAFNVGEFISEVF